MTPALQLSISLSHFFALLTALPGVVNLPQAAGDVKKTEDFSFIGAS
jgi:hypothetical protein